MDNTIQDSLSKLDHFLDLIDSNHLFETTDPEHYRRFRAGILDVLYRMLIWQRPDLEHLRGIMWPYDALAKRADFFKHHLNESTESWKKHQALLFLALLPFPAQWRYLSMAENAPEIDPEIRSFTAHEREKIDAKLEKKAGKKFQIHRFCQVLKAPAENEKGVLRIFAMPYLFIDADLLRKMNRNWVFYVEPPMGVNFRHTWLRVFSTLDDPTLVGVGSEEDAVFLGSQPNIVVTRLAHGDFLEDAISVPLDVEKEFDIIFNATFDDMPRKRHELMLDLMNHPLLDQTRTLFLGRGSESDIRAFGNMVDEKGLNERVVFKYNLRREEVPEQIARCRIGVHLSLYENACRSIYEFFRSDLPCVIASSMAGMNMEIFNSQTGHAVPDALLPETLRRVIDERETYSPRKWFLSQSGSRVSSRRLNEQLEDLFKKAGYSWTTDIADLTGGGSDRYTHQAELDRFAPAYESLANLLKKRSPLVRPMGG